MLIPCETEVKLQFVLKNLILIAVSLTKTTKKGLELKQHVVTEVRSCVEKYNTILLFSVDNMRSDKLTKLRIEWRDSRFFLGKNKVIALALGKTPESEIANGISQLSSELKGEVGLLFTNESKKTVRLSCNKFCENT